MKRVALILFFILPLAACTDKLAQSAYVTIVGAKAATDQAKTQHPECTQPGAVVGTNTCTIISKAVAAKDSLIDAMEVYCAGPDFDAGKACDSPAKGTPAATQAIAKVNAALAGWTQASTDLQGALK